MFLQVLPAVLGFAGGSLAVIWLGLERKSAQNREFVKGTGDRRFLPRPAVNFSGTLHREDGTPPCRVRGLDLHRAGAQVSTGRAFKPGSQVYFHASSLNLGGFAHVRHCARHGVLRRYRVGLEFRGGLMKTELGTWQVQSRNAN